MHTEGHDMGKDAVGNTAPAAQAPKFDAEHPGYETTDVRVTGIAWFLAGLFGTVLMFFVLCWVLGKGINSLQTQQYTKEYGAPSKWTVAAGNVPEGKGGNLTSNTEIEQKQLAQVTSNFPSPRLDMDDGNQSTAFHNDCIAIWIKCISAGKKDIEIAAVFIYQFPGFHTFGCFICRIEDNVIVVQNIGFPVEKAEITDRAGSDIYLPDVFQTEILIPAGKS